MTGSEICGQTFTSWIAPSSEISMTQPNEWEELKRTLSIGSLVTGKVTMHFPFGIFVCLPDIEFDGLIQITDFKDEGRMTVAEYPAIGTDLSAVVLGFKATGNQIWLGMKPSQLRAANKF